MTDDQQARYDAMLRAKLTAAREQLLDLHPELTPEQRAKLLSAADRLRGNEWGAVVRAVAAATRGDWDDPVFGGPSEPDVFAMPALWGRGGEA